MRMQQVTPRLRNGRTLLLMAATLFLAGRTCYPAAQDPANAMPIPPDQIAAVAGKNYQGDGLSVTATANGARLRCVFQRMEGEVTGEGLWLMSTVTNAPSDRFRVMAAEIGRVARPATDNATHEATCPAAALPDHGNVTVNGQTVRFTRPGLVEEYSVSMDGVRQDFIIEQRPDGEGRLRVKLDVSGAQAEPVVQCAQLTLTGSGRKLAYSRLRVADAKGTELPASMETAATRLTIVVDDADALYPVRIDPTFSDANWISMGGLPGANGSVLAAVLDETGNLYIGGSFTNVGDVFATNIARWNGSNWWALGSGVNGQVSALAVSGTDLYAGGSFTNAGGIPANRVAKWNGSAWSALGSGMNGQVSVLAVSGTDLYAGGNFTNAGGIPANRIGKWNGSDWSALGTGMNNSVGALAVSGSDLYAGGSFTNAGGIAADRVAKWNGSAWSALGSGSERTVSALVVSGSDLYAGGRFTVVGGATHLAKWNGSIWSALGSGINSFAVRALAVSGGDLYAGGDFQYAGGPANLIAKWNGSSWSPLSLGLGGPDGGFPSVYALAVSGTNVYAGGSFTTATNTGQVPVTVDYIAKWNGSSWSGMGSGLGGGVVSALTVSGSDVYAGGTFTTAGGRTARRIAKWNGSSWSALGSGFIGTSFPNVSALAVSGSNLYAGGTFSMAGGVAANHIAKWNGSSWSALGSGMERTDGSTAGVGALAVSGNDLYAAGFFTTAGGMAATNIAKWNGSSWSALGSGMGGATALVLLGSDLYAGGKFTNAGGIVATNIAKWNGSSWSALGSGVSGPPGNPYYGGSVFALAVSGSNLYVGGNFTTAGGNVANSIAKWNGSSWSALGSGVAGAPPTFGSPSVYALAVSGTDLFAGGNFTNAGGIAVNYIARWNGSSWSVLGSGMNNFVNELAVSGSDLYVGGGFTTAGGKPSAYVARASLPLPELSIHRSGPDVMVSWPTDFSGGFILEQAEAVSPPVAWMTNTATMANDGTNKSVTIPATNSAQFFRLRLESNRQLPSSLLGYWRFDEAAGTLAHDRSGRGNDAPILGASWGSSHFGPVLCFDGLDDYVDISELPDLNRGTIEVWVNGSVFTDEQEIISGILVSDFETLNGEFRIYVGEWLSSGVVLAPNAWYHLVATFDGSIWKVYVNGALRSSLATSYFFNHVNKFIGQYHEFGPYNWKGCLADVKIYSQALSDEEVLSNFGAGPR